MGPNPRRTANGCFYYARIFGSAKFGRIWREPGKGLRKGYRGGVSNSLDPVFFLRCIPLCQQADFDQLGYLDVAALGQYCQQRGLRDVTYGQVSALWGCEVVLSLPHFLQRFATSRWVRVSRTVLLSVPPRKILFFRSSFKLS